RVERLVHLFPPVRVIRLGPQRHARALRVRLAAAVLASQPAARERTERHESDTSVLAEWEHLALGRAIEQTVRILNPAEPCERTPLADRQRPRKAPRVDIARADVEHLAGADAIVEGDERLLERRLRIRLVNQIQIEAIGLQPRQAGVDLT